MRPFAPLIRGRLPPIPKGWREPPPPSLRMRWRERLLGALMFAGMCVLYVLAWGCLAGIVLIVLTGCDVSDTQCKAAECRPPLACEELKGRLVQVDGIADAGHAYDVLNGEVYVEFGSRLGGWITCAKVHPL